MTPPAPTTVEDVLARLQALGEELAPRDGVAVFNRVYLTATRETAHRLAAGHFEDTAFTAEWTARFAALYLAAVTGGRPTACWRPLLRARRDHRVHPLQSALAGMNAHIAHDLPLALTATCRSRRTAPARVRADFDRLNAVLAGVERRVREDLLPGPDPLEAADPLTHLVCSWGIEQARDAAWSTAALLWRLRRHPAAAAQLTQRLAHHTGLVSRLLLTPLGGR